MGIMDDANNMKRDAKDKLDSTDMDEKAKAKFDKMHGDKDKDTQGDMSDQQQ